MTPAPTPAPAPTSPALKKKRRLRVTRGVLILASISIVLFVGGYLLAVYVMFPPPAAPTVGVVVPDLRGMTLPLARDRLQPLGLETGDTVSMPNSQSPTGLIIAQSPLPGQQARSGGRVSVGLSSGPPAVTIPNVVGYGSRRAQNLLQRLGFDVASALENSDRPNGIVLRSHPEAGNKVPLPARITIVVSAGPPDSVTVDTITSRSTR